MKTKLKKAPAILIAAVMLLSCILPFGALAATEQDIESLETAISSYESTMAAITFDLAGGTAYSGLSDAYKAYIAAEEVLMAYNSGDDSVDAAAATSALATATAAIAKWTPATAGAQGYYNGTALTEGYSNLLYCSSGITASSSNTTGNVTAYFHTPTTVVMFYDGETQPSFPVGFGAYSDGSNKRIICYVYLTDSLADQDQMVGTEGSLTDAGQFTSDTASSIYAFQHYWYGVDSTTNGWTNAADATVKFGYYFGDTSQTWTPPNSKNNYKYLNNQVFYIDQPSDTDGLVTISDMKFVLCNSQRNSSRVSAANTTQYVVNYKPIADYAAAKATLLGQALTDNGGIGSYLQGGLSDLMAAVDAFTSDSVNPTAYSYTDDDTAAASAKSCGAAITKAVNTYSSAVAGSTDSEAVATLQAAINDYQAAMENIADDMQNGTAYTNLSTAYQAYIDACAALDSYFYGGNTRVNFINAADALTTATAAIEKWTAAEFNATVYHQGGVNQASDYYNNVVYCSGDTNWTNILSGSPEFKIVGQENMVLAYDGTNKVVMPVSFEIYATVGSSLTDTFRVYTVYSNSTVFGLKENWAGVNSDYKDSNRYTYFPTDTASGQASTTNYTGYYYISNSGNDYSTNTEANSTGFWGNKYYFIGDDSTFGSDYYVVEQGSNITWTVGWKQNGDTLTMSTGNGGYVTYVLNYVPVIENAASLAAALGTALSTNGVDSYLQGGLSELTAALDAFTSDRANPNAYSYSDGVETAVQSYNTAVSNAVSTYADATAGSTDDSGYADLVKALTADGVSLTYGTGDNTAGYTLASWAAFTAAYETALAIEYDLAKTDYNDNTAAAAAASALSAAYAALKVADAETLDSVTNTFTAAADASVAVNETFNDNIKSNVSVQNNTVGYSTYIRAAIVVSWVDGEGNVLAELPELGTDYSLTLTENSGWTLASDGYYYYASPVNAGESTGVLISECKQLLEKDGYTLRVDVLAQSIQSAGTTDDTDTPFVTDAWGVTVNDDGTITK